MSASEHNLGHLSVFALGKPTTGLSLGPGPSASALCDLYPKCACPTKGRCTRLPTRCRYSPMPLPPYRRVRLVPASALEFRSEGNDGWLFQDGRRARTKRRCGISPTSHQSTNATHVSILNCSHPLQMTRWRLEKRRSWGRCTRAMPAKTHQRTLPAAAPRACSLGAGCLLERLPGWSSLGRPPSGSFRLRQQVREPSFQPSAPSACGCSLEQPELLRVDTLIPVST